jgi:hypothetical protein
MRGKLTIIPVEGEITTREITEAPDYRELQSLVGGYIEAVPAWYAYKGEPCAVFCNEEGKLEGLATNVRATFAWYAAAGGDLGDVLVGDVVIIQGDDELMRAL